MEHVPTVLDAHVLEAYARRVRTAIPFIVISLIFSTILLPLLGMLFALSTAQSRRTPIFILNVVAISLGLVVGVLCSHLSIKNIFSPSSGVNADEDFTFSIIYVWMPWITEGILLLRVIVIFRPACARLTHLLALLAVPILLKIARATVNILFLLKLEDVTTDAAMPSRLEQFDATMSVGKVLIAIGWILELFDNGYISALFLWRLVKQVRAFDDIRIEHMYHIQFSSEDSFTSRLKTLFWIASTNFVFPFVFGLGQVVLLFTQRCVFVAACLGMVNVYVSIISTVFATIWAATNSIDHNALSENRKPPTHEPIVLHLNQIEELSLATDIWGKDLPRNVIAEVLDLEKGQHRSTFD